MERLRKQKTEERTTAPSKLTEEEKQKKLQEMQAASQALQDQRRDRSGYTAAEAIPDKLEGAGGGGKFLKDIRAHIYMDSEMNLEDRINR